MRKPHESSADRVWKEKLETCASPQEALVLLLLVVAILATGALLAMGL
jgi:hypothetical protein